MKPQFLRIPLALVCFAALAITAKAQEVNQLVVNIPFEFVAAGKTLPAGNYEVKRLSGDKLKELVLSGPEAEGGVFVFASEVESVRDGKTQISFEQAGERHFLSKIETRDHVFNIEVPRAATLLASSPSPSGTASGSSDGNN